MLHWKLAFCSKDFRVDEEHKKLFQLLNDLSNLRRESDIQDLNPVLDQLLEHTFAHFLHEDEVMRQAGYPEAESHAEEHVSLRTDLIEGLRSLVKGITPVPLFVYTIQSRFKRHFSHEDMAFALWHKSQDGAVKEVRAVQGS